MAYQERVDLTQGGKPSNTKRSHSRNPDRDREYSFRVYMAHIAPRVMFTDLGPHEQAAAFVGKLGGPARELTRVIAPQELVGGVRG